MRMAHANWEWHAIILFNVYPLSLYEICEKPSRSKDELCHYMISISPNCHPIVPLSIAGSLLIHIHVSRSAQARSVAIRDFPSRGWIKTVLSNYEDRRFIYLPSWLILSFDSLLRIP